MIYSEWEKWGENNFSDLVFGVLLSWTRRILEAMNESEKTAKLTAILDAIIAYQDD